MHRAFLIDDERLARSDLRALLSSRSDVEIVGEADCLQDAIRGIQESKPDLLFLDIQLHGETGFDLFDRMEVSQRVVFVTAYDAFAIRAFEVNALDYLLKPVRTRRLDETIRRLMSAPEQRLESGSALRYEDRMILSLDGVQRCIEVSEVVCIRAAGDYSELYATSGGSGLVLCSMKEWEERLPTSQFARIHRSTIVNLSHIDRIEPQNNYTSPRVHAAHVGAARREPSIPVTHPPTTWHGRENMTPPSHWGTAFQVTLGFVLLGSSLGYPFSVEGAVSAPASTGSTIQVEQLSIPVAGDISLAGTHYSPGGPGVGILLLSMCNPTATQQGWTTLANSLAGAGFHVLTFDYRGYGEERRRAPLGPQYD